MSTSTADKEEVWVKKYSILKKKCDNLEQENESLYWKLKKVKKMVSQSEIEKKFLEKRLLQHKRTTPIPKKTPPDKPVNHSSEARSNTDTKNSKKSKEKK